MCTVVNTIRRVEELEKIDMTNICLENKILRIEGYTANRNPDVTRMNLLEYFI